MQASFLAQTPENTPAQGCNYPSTIAQFSLVIQQLIARRKEEQEGGGKSEKLLQIILTCFNIKQCQC